MAERASAAYEVAYLREAVESVALGLRVIVPVRENNVTRPVVGQYGTDRLSHICFGPFDGLGSLNHTSGLNPSSSPNPARDRHSKRISVVAPSPALVVIVSERKSRVDRHGSLCCDEKEKNISLAIIRSFLWLLRTWKILKLLLCIHQLWDCETHLLGLLDKFWRINQHHESSAFDQLLSIFN